MRHPPAPALPGGLALALCLALLPTPARADVFGADIPVLGAILVQAAQTAATVTQTLTTLRESYEEARRLAGYADDAYRTFQAFQDYNAELFARDLVTSLEAAYPDVAYFRREASHAGPWARGSGELQRLVTLCLSGPAGSCARYQEALSLQQTRRALAETFGIAPEGAYDLAAVDHESAVALAAGSAQEGRSARARQVSDALMRECASLGASGRSSAACQAAGAAAQVEQLKVSADIAEQVAAGNRLQVLQLQLQGAQRKRELAEAEERRHLLLDGIEQASRRPPRVQTEGFDLLDGSAP